jgi:hypothetical protein
MAKKLSRYLALCCSCSFLIGLITVPLRAVDPKEVYTGTVVAFGGVRTRGGTSSATFTLKINGYTSDEDAQRFLTILAEEKQAGLLKALSNENLGTFAIGGQVGRQVKVARVAEVNGQRRIVAVFERWLLMAEVRGGYRSQDYPFGYIELFIGPDGKGEGTYIGAAKITWKSDENTGKKTVEIENFGTYPAKMMGVMRRNK